MSCNINFMTCDQELSQEKQKCETNNDSLKEIPFEITNVIKPVNENSDRKNGKANFSPPY